MKLNLHKGGVPAQAARTYRNHRALMLERGWTARVAKNMARPFPCNAKLRARVLYVPAISVRKHEIQ